MNRSGKVMKSGAIRINPNMLKITTAINKANNRSKRTALFIIIPTFICVGYKHYML